MRRIGSHSLGDFPSAVVRIDCERCGRAGSYGRDRLISQFGADAALPDVLMALAECERRADFSRARWATRGTEGGTSGGAESWIMRCNSAIGSRSPFSTNGQPTIRTKTNPPRQIGQRNALSAGDIAAVAALYP